MKYALRSFFLCFIFAAKIIAQESPAKVETPPSPPASPSETKPAAPPDTPPQPVETEPKLPTQPPVAPADTARPPEPELDEETKKQIEAAKQKILKEKAEREEAQRRAKENGKKSFLGSLLESSRLFGGINGGLGLSANSIHGLGVGFGGFVEYRLLEHYGFVLGLETGQYSSKNYPLKSKDYTLTLSEGGSLGYFAINPSLQYTLPAWLPVELNVALGLSIYSLRGGSYSFKTAVSPRFAISGYYNLFSRISVGALFDCTIASTSSITSESVDYTLDNSTSLTRLSLQAIVRYQIF